MDFRREPKLGLNLGKRAGSSESYRQAQYRSVEAGTHYSQVGAKRSANAGYYALARERWIAPNNRTAPKVVATNSIPGLPSGTE